MINRAFLTALLLFGATNAKAETCTIPTDDEVQARTAKCLLSIDGKLLVNERCNFHVSPDGHGTTLDAGKYYVEVNVIPKASTNATMAFWNRGSGRSDQLASLGPVTWFNRSGADCFRNRRFEMCASEYQTCKCGPNEEYGCKPADAN
ncbi:hypothetical protein [Bradyrhizobium sp. UNPA324]|uniref:hypothetical protein n=1 Tax=Bradyrhizobium sp. UNPA324 TaxID=1141174 RepID=UPI0011513EE9|nr:hypothetical protein [Bradyrhizobium sp. UNPA324]TQF30016.1 hypothetical protein UNPA324_10565 [Bradyrhizobium sp. UNPA324]